MQINVNFIKINIGKPYQVKHLLGKESGKANLTNFNWCTKVDFNIKIRVVKWIGSMIHKLCNIVRVNSEKFQFLIF